jgi:hypothetical protein
MYTACTVQMARALDLPDLLPIAQVFVWPALAAWLATFVGMVRGLLRSAARLA